MRLLPIAAALTALALSLPASAEAPLAGITGEDYRLFCGYLEALEAESIQKIKNKKKRDKAIAKMAKLPEKKLLASVKKVEAKGATCDEVGKIAERESEKALTAALDKRVLVYVLDYGDPSHVVASVTWMAMDKKKVVQEASLIALTLAEAAPIAKTIALRAMQPGVTDPKKTTAVWFEANIAPDRAVNMDRSAIADSADIRYIRLFDGVKCAAPLAHETALGFRRGPCEGKTM